MDTILTIAKKEFKAYFFSPIAYVFIITFLVLSNFLFFRTFFIAGQADMRMFFSLMPWIFLLLIPSVSMSKWSEEKKLGSIELLLTLPVKDVQVVAGKFLASLALVMVAIALTITIPVTVSFMGDMDVGPIIGGYIGLVFLGGAYLSIGLFVSSLTENQIIAFIICAIICFVFLLVGEPIFTMNLPEPLIIPFQYLGLGTHFASVGRGVLDSRDLIYYLSIIGFFLWLNLKAVDARGVKINKKGFLATAAGIIIALCVLNFLSSRHFIRADLTEKHEYTLSKSTRDILKGLDDVVNIQLYFSKKLPPAVQVLKREVDDILSEYRTYAGNRLHIRYINPQESAQEEYRVQMMGIPPVQVNVIERDKQELAKLYLGMAIVHSDKKEILPVVQGSRNLEYDLTSAILKVTSKEEPEIKWLSDAGEDNYSEIKNLLVQRYKIKNITPDKLDLSPERDQLLVITRNEDLTEDEIKEIDAYLESGGKVFIMADQAKVENNLQVMKLELPNIMGWLGGKKIEIKDKFLLDKSNTYAAFTGGYITYQIPYPFWVKVTRETFDQASPIVSDIDSLILPWVSPIEIGAETPEGATYTVLARSSQFVSVAALDEPLLPENAQRLMAMGSNGQKPLIVMAALKNNGQLLVVGNTRFIKDNALSQFKANTIFFENAVDYMAMGNQLIGIRSKGTTDRPITVNVSDAGIILAKYINTVGASILLVIAGMVIMMIRRQTRHRLKSIYC